MRRLFLLALSLLLTGHAVAQDSIWLGKTMGKFPFLAYGIGDDRLGGAKIGYLDSNVILNIVDSFLTDYKVRLSANHTAYISKGSVALLRKEKGALPAHNSLLTGSMKAYGEPDADVLGISLPAAMPYRSYQLTDPSRIVIEVYGVSANTNWINQLKSLREIRSVWCEQPEDDVFRVSIALRHAQHWGHSISYDSSGRKMIVRVKRQPPVLDIRKMRIAIDAGHGGDNNGTSGVRQGTLEKQLTLVLAKDLEKVLRAAGVRQIFMTRTRDTSLGMPERMEMVRAFNPDFLVSIHLNSANSDTVQGVSTYYRYIGYRPPSMAILNQLLTLGLKEFGNIGNFNFALNGPVEYPNTLVEVAFLSNPQDERKILNPAFQKAVARKIYLGIADWLRSLK